MTTTYKIILTLLVTTIIFIGVSMYPLFIVPKKKIPVSVNLKWLHQAQFAGIYTANEKKFYEKEGLDVTIKKGGPDAPSINAVLSGATDFGIAGDDDLLVAICKGSPILAIAVI